MSDLNRLPPYNLDAERSVIGACLLDKSALVVSTEILQEDDFYDSINAKVFDKMAEMFEKGKAVDVLMVMEELGKTDLLDKIGGQAFFAGVMDAVTTTAHVEHHARIVREKSIYRRMIRAGSAIVQLGYSQDREVDDVLDEAEQLIFQIGQHKGDKGYIHIKDVLGGAFHTIEERFGKGRNVTGVPSGFIDFDNLTAGFQPGSLNIVAARPSMGKTSFALNIAQHVSINFGVPVLVFSLEMSCEQLALRMLGAEARVNVHDLLTGMFPKESWPKLAAAAGKLSEAPIYIDDSSLLASIEVRAKSRRFKAEHKKLGLIVVDYLQLLHTKQKIESKQQEVSEISRSLKALARELEVPVIALSQLSRAVEQRQDKRPQLSDLRDSGAIEQDADLVAFIYRPDFYNPQAEGQSLAEVIIGKHRNGPTGLVNLTFFKEYARFENSANIPMGRY